MMYSFVRENDQAVVCGEIIASESAPFDKSIAHPGYHLFHEDAY